MPYEINNYTTKLDDMFDNDKMIHTKRKEIKVQVHFHSQEQHKFMLILL